MLEGARMAPKAGGQQGLEDYLDSASLTAFFGNFLKELAEELKFSDPDLEPKRAKRARKKFVRRYCVCNSEYDSEAEGMVGCDSCADWFHFSCIGISEEQASDPSFDYHCSMCQRRSRVDE